MDDEYQGINGCDRKIRIDGSKWRMNRGSALAQERRARWKLLKRYESF